jgi:hypothetical protein
MVPRAFDICVIATSLVRVAQEIALVIYRRPFDDGAMAFPEEVPRHDVRVMLHDGEYDFVALADIRFAP